MMYFPLEAFIIITTCGVFFVCVIFFYLYNFVNFQCKDDKKTKLKFDDSVQVTIQDEYWTYPAITV